ncbi:family 43 glycosylhydrolase [Natrialba aegyptia]|uniref:Glycoside hydrolase family 43 n=1 Tax=Natrialba aegyptia DSM 13077 TaxID=1227491 RepID=M0AJV6_9EURY|nr:family 43 glycosylhydrolase [Natrialba aegyptia]ELY97678.1 glycoside hydrolase family 43 [Natrialba aegyptia DSM 13077]
MVFNSNSHKRRNVLAAIGAGAVGALGYPGGGTRTARADNDGEHYHNPVYADRVFPDPTVVRVGDMYYAYASNMEKDGEDQEEMVPIVKSADLHDWTYVGEAFESYPDWRDDDASLWAPDINYYNGQYYLYYSYSTWGSSDNPGIGLATADTPEGPFTDQGPVFREDELSMTNAIDSDFFVVDGTPYMVWGSFYGIYGVELTPDGTDYVNGTTVHLAGDNREAAKIVEANGYYYLFYSTGYCCEGYDSTYEIEVGRSANALGPYTNQNGTDLRNLNDHNSGVAIVSGNSRFPGPGHNTAIRDDTDDLWLLYHAYDRREPEYVDGTWNRIMLADRIRWDNDGWPVLGCYGTPTAQHPRSRSGDECATTGPLAEGTYRVANVETGSLLEVADASTSDGANVRLYPDTGHACQRWRVRDWGNEAYAFENANSDQLLEVAGASTTDGGNIQQWPSNGHPTQRWHLLENGDGTYRLENINSGLVADTANGSNGDGTNVLQRPWTGADSQRWTVSGVNSDVNR